MKKANVISIDQSNIGIILLIAVAFSVLSIPIIGRLISIFSLTGKLPRHGDIRLVLLDVVLTLAVHELVHGLFFRLFGKKPAFGFKMLFYVLPVFATSSVGSKLNTSQMLSVGLSPLIVVSALSMYFMSIPTLAAYGVLAFSVNFVGSCADVYLATQLAKYWRKPVYVEDTGTGFKITPKG